MDIKTHVSLVYKSIFFIFLTCLSVNVFAVKAVLPWSLEIGLGYGQYQNMYVSDGQVFLARVGIAKEVIQYLALHGGMELGIQSGNTARLKISDSEKYALGGLPIDTTIKPMLDMLLTGKVYTQLDSPLYGIFKAGAIVRHWQFNNRGSINDITRVDPEFQLGVGMDVAKRLSLSLSYQGIIGRNPDFKIISPDCEAHVSNISGMNSVVLGITIIFD